MADDVKVKFGGDFTDVPKGAETAVQSAGTIMGKWFGDYAKGLKDKLASAFSLDAIVSRFAEGFSASLEKFKEIDTIAKKLNVTRVELQQFAKLGKEFNMDMETMGRSIAFANKTLGAAAEGNKQAQNKLMQMGFTQKEVTSGNLKATEVLYKLAEAYEKNKKIYGEAKASNLLAIDTTNTFGRAGADLVTILKLGNEAMKERIKLMNIYSEAQVRGGARLARQKEKAEAGVQKVYGDIMGFFGSNLEEVELGKIVSSAKVKSGFEFNLENTTKSGQEKLIKEQPELIKSIAKNMTEEATKKGINTKDLVDMLKESKFDTNRPLYDALAKQIESNIKPPTGETEIKTGTKALVASSLQEIGGGDIGSVMSGLGPNAIAENTLRTAVATEQIAGQQHAQPPPAKLR